MRRARVPSTASVLIAAAAVAGCGGADPTAPERVATSFERAVATGDAETACALLSPTVRAAVGEDAGGSCPDAVRESPPSSSPDVVRASRYGRQAVVVTGGDTLFLAEFSDGWKVIGAGCTREPDDRGTGKPYDCAISGG